MYTNGVEKYLYPMPHAQTKLFAYGTSSFPQNLKLQKGAYENFCAPLVGALLLQFMPSNAKLRESPPAVGG